MKFVFEYNETDDRLPIAFVDNVGDLWFRTNDADDIRDNQVNVMTKRGDILGSMSMLDFIDAIDNKPCAVKVVKTFYEGDVITIQF